MELMILDLTMEHQMCNWKDLVKFPVASTFHVPIYWTWNKAQWITFDLAHVVSYSAQIILCSVKVGLEIIGPKAIIWKAQSEWMPCWKS